MRSLLLFLSLFLFSATVQAQQHKGLIEGLVVDSTSGKPVSLATVSVFLSSDTSLITYRLSDEKGMFRVTGLPLSTPLRVVVTYSGFGVFRREFTLPSTHPSLKLGTVFLKETSLTLNEIIIQGERPPVVIRKDTIEFNASSFKTLPDALVEDLLRKLPGVHVDKDGQILVNGRRVSTLYVDGKDFFGGDVRIASKNLPANVIDKVQVTNDKEALRDNPLLAEADIPQVINLKLKPGIKKGAFGKAYLGGGIKNKGESGALFNLFRDTTQLSLLAYANNLNKAGFSFTDLRSAGGFNRGSWGNANGNGNGGLSIDKVSFGGYGSGVMTSSGGGGNFNTILKDKIQLNLSYFYGAVISDYDELRNSRQLWSDTLLNTRQHLDEQSRNYAHMISSRISFPLSPHIKIEYKPTVVFTRDLKEQLFQISSTQNYKGLVNQNNNEQQFNDHGFTYLSWLRIMPTFKKKGRSLNFTNHTSIDRTENRLSNLAENTFFDPSSVVITDQLRQTDSRQLRNFTIARYTDQLSEQLILTGSIDFTYFNQRNQLESYLPDANGEYLILLPSLSENFIRKGFHQNIGAGFRWKLKKWAISSSLGLGALRATNAFLNQPAVQQRFTFFLPSLELGYGIFTFNYQANFREPAAVHLQPVPNNTNPLFIRNGNPFLKPSYHHSYTIGLRKYEPGRSLTYHLSLNASTIKDATILSRTVDSQGIQTTTPTNVDGTWNAGTNMSLQKDFRWTKQHQLSLTMAQSFSYLNSILLLNQLRSDYQTFHYRPSVELRLNLNDKVEFLQAYAISHYRSRYADAFFQSQQVVLHDAKTDFILRPSPNWVWDMTLDYRYQSNSAPGLLKSYYRWNAGLTYLFLKGRKGQLKLAVNDILDQNIIASRVVRENLTEDMQGSTIRRHALLTFTYHLRNFGEKAGGRRQLFNF